MIRNFFQFLWRLLPDRCEVEACPRSGLRGNENMIDGVIMCDYCHARHLLRRVRS
jgi:hypothetical protein